MAKSVTKKIITPHSSHISKTDITFTQYKVIAEDIEKRLEPKFDAINSKFDAINSKFDAINSKFDAIDVKFDAINSRLDSFKWVITIIITLLIAMFAGIVGLFFK